LERRRTRAATPWPGRTAAPTSIRSDRPTAAATTWAVSSGGEQQRPPARELRRDVPAGPRWRRHDRGTA
jgi:hypothetical protein